MSGWENMNKEFNPMVSIIIPVYNGSNYMREAIDSALAQTYKNIEVIVINDGSNDNGETEKIAKEYGDKIIYIYKENGGVSTALNLGIKTMKGEYFSWLSHDDVYTEDKIEKQVKALSYIEDKNTLVCCDYIHIDKDSNVIGTIPNVESKTSKILSWKYMLMDLFTNGPVHGCALMIPKSVFESVGLFDETLRFYQDGFMWYKIFMKKYSVLLIPDICVKGRIHNKQLTQTGQDVFRKDSETVSYHIIPELVQVSTVRNNYLKAYIKNNAKYGNKNVVKKALDDSRNSGLINSRDRFSILFFSAYGRIRPTIRKIYYILFR